MSTKYNQAKHSLHNYFAIFSLLIVIGFSQTIFAETLTGTLGVIWGDSQNGKLPSQIEYTLEQSNGKRIRLNLKQNIIANAGGLSNLQAKQVIITTDDSVAPFSQSGATNNTKEVTSISPLNSALTNAQALVQQGLAGPQKYVSILCKFSDKSAEPENWGFFNAMYGNAAGQLGHFWKEVSSNDINLSGSRAYGGTNGNNGWYTLPSPRSAYVNATHPNGDLGLLFTDCVGVADAHINFSDVKGINLMFNDTIGNFAWGGGLTTTLDGVTKFWPTTWEPTWGWKNVSVMAHEMGHSFGLPHSNNSDGDSNPYDNPWSIMSDAWNYAIQDPVYGTRGKHVNAHEKNQLNWLTNGEKFTAPDGETHTLNIDSLSDNLAGAGAYRMVKIPFLTGSKYYTVEARETTGDYEANLPGTAIIIHEVDESRNEPAWVVDKDTPPAGSADTEGVMWKVGETFTDSANNISVTINATTTRGFEVTVNRGGVVTPNKATLISPSGQLTDSTPAYTWNAVSNATWYHLSVTDSTGNKILTWYSAIQANCSSGSGTCSVTPATALASGAGSWTIRTWNSAGNGPISATMNFTVNGLSKPSIATLVSPSGTISDTTPTYTWNAVSNSTWYYLSVTDSTGNKILTWYSAIQANCSSGSGTCSVTPATALASGAGSWAIRTWNSAGNGPISATMNFTVNGLSKPSIATLVSPSGTISDATPTYTWNAVSNSTWYYLSVTDSTGSKILTWYSAIQAGCSSGMGTCSATPSTALASGSGVWTIRTWNSAGNGPISATMNFTVNGLSKPSVATLVSPSGTISDTTPTYTWNAVSNATWYNLWVNDSTGNKIKKWYSATQAGCGSGSGTGTCSITPTTTLANGAGLWWIKTWNSAGHGPWSSANNFTIQ